MQRTEARSPRLPFLRLFSLVAIVTGLAEIVYMFARQGFSLRSVLSYAAIGQLTSMNRSEFVYGDQQQTIPEQIGFLCLYFGALTGGLVFKFGAHRLDRLIGVLNLLLPAIVFTLFGSRMGLLYGGSFWVSSYLSARIFGSNRDADGRFLLRVGGLAAVLLVGVQMLVQVVRYSTERDPVPLFRMLADPFGFLAAFGQWFNHAGWQFSGFTVGARTFRRIVALVGIAQPPLPEVGVGFTSSNIYTVLRDLIEDFGTVGALLVLFAYGYASRLAHVRARAGDPRYIGVLSLAFAFTLTSFSVSIFFYSVTALAIFAFVVYCFVFARAGDPEPAPVRDHMPARVPPGFRFGHSDS